MQEIFNAYKLLHDDFQIEAFGNGLINQTWRIKNANNDFILQRINDAIFKQPDAIASNVKRIVDYLSEGHPGYLLAAPVKTQTNDEMAFITGRGYFRLTPFYTGVAYDYSCREPLPGIRSFKKVW